MGMGYLPYWMMYQCLMATFLFYLAHWQTYVTGEYCFKLIIIREKKCYINICCWNYTTVHWYSSMQKWSKSTSWPLDTISYTQWAIYLKMEKGALWKLKRLGEKKLSIPNNSTTCMYAREQNEEKLAIIFTDIFCNQKCAHSGVQLWSFLL